jgi:hypothetical protein
MLRTALQELSEVCDTDANASELERLRLLRDVYISKVNAVHV